MNNISSLIANAAANAGVPTSVALGVARVESGIQHWRPDGTIVTSSKGAIGVMQLLPGTAAQLGVNPDDLNQNIQGGVAYLAQLYSKYQDWALALAAYNWGPGSLDRALSTGAAIPQSVQNYAAAVLGSAGSLATSAGSSSSVNASSNVLPFPGVKPGASYTLGTDYASTLGLSDSAIAVLIFGGATLLALLWD